MKPVYKVTMGSESFDSTNNAGALSINVDCDLNIPLDAFKVVLKQGDKVAIKGGDPVVIQMGYDDSPETVFTGTVDSVERGITGITITGYSLAAPLTRQKIHQVYEKQTAGAIVQDLAVSRGLKVKAIDDGISFPMYVVDESRPVYSHMRELSAMCGFDLYLSPRGEIVFKKYLKKKAVPYTYGVNIIDASSGATTPRATCVKVYGESPSSFKGGDTAHWLSSKEVEGVAGSGDPVMVIENPAIRDKDTADKVAAAALESLSISASGTLKTFGEPSAVLLCDTIEIKDMPDAALNDTFKVTRVSHSFNMEEGFVTTLGWAKPASP